MSSAHPYRDPERKMSPMYFSSDRNYPFFLDLRDIRFVQLESNGEWSVKFKSESYILLSSQEGAKLYNALRAYSESHYEPMA
jgi:hypothetical protein